MMIYNIGIAIALFLSCILLTKKRKEKSDWILAVWLLIIAIHLGSYALAITGEIFAYPHLLGYEKLLPLLHGPCLYLYSISFTRKECWSWKTILHLIPFLMGFVLIFPFLVLDATTKMDVYQNNGIGFTGTSKALLVGALLSGFFYSALTLREILLHEKKIKNNYSQIEKINLQWLLRLTIGLSLIWVVVFIAPDPYIYTACVIYVLVIGYYGIKQTSIFAALPAEHPPTEAITILTTEPGDDNSNGSAKYEKSLLKEPQMEMIKSQLELLMHEKKWFLTPELTLTMVANQLQVHPNALSQVINRTEQKNFFDYINYLRIEEFKKKLAIPENEQYTIIALAYECGFNSKTAFNRNFKTFTGCSPSEYRKNKTFSTTDHNT
jgi:AraC-like DNA-binding protein